MHGSLHECLSFYHILNDPKEEAFGKYHWKSRKCWEPAFSPFPTKFSAQSNREIVI